MNHLSVFISKTFNDSDAAKRIRSKRKKTTCIIENAIAPVMNANLVEHLRKNFFSLIVDETTDISVTKSMAICVRTLYGNKIVSQFYRLIEVNYCGAKGSTTAIFDTLKKDQISVSNITRLVSDGANVMSGDKESVYSSLKERAPNLFYMKCICHSAHLVSKHACHELPRSTEDFVSLTVTTLVIVARRHEF
jgi:hypothetical protein